MTKQKIMSKHPGNGLGNLVARPPAFLSSIRCPRFRDLAALLLLLLPVVAQASDPFTTVDLGKTPNAEHTKAFTDTIGFDTWLRPPEITLRGIRFALAAGPADLVRLPPDGRVEMVLPAYQASRVHLLLTGGYLSTPGSVRVEVKYTSGFHEEHTLDVSDWNFGANYPDVCAQTLDAAAFGGQGKSLYVHSFNLRRRHLIPASLCVTAGDRGVYLLAGVTLEGERSQAERLADLAPSDLAIDTGASKDPVVRFAAEQLQLYASRMEGKRPLIDSEGRRRIFLGKLPTSLPDPEKKELEDRLAKLGPDGFILRSRPDALLILGGGARGILYGTYAFLERCGVRFFFPGEESEVVPKAPISLVGIQTEEKPDWERRGLTYYPYEFNEPADWVDFAGKVRLNTILFHAPSPDWWERERTVLTPELARRGIHPEFGGHFLPGLLPRDLFKEHPDWFREENGQRKADWNFCPSSPGAMAQIARGAADLVRRCPEPEVFSIWPDDLGGGGWCHCPRCRGMKPSDQSLLAMNAMAREIQKVRADARVVFLAYQDTEEAPTQVRPEPGVTLLWAPRERCYTHALDDPKCPRNVGYLQRLEGCLKVFPRAEAEAFEYYLDQILYADLVPTLPGTLAGDLRCYRRLGMKVIEPLMVSLIPFRPVLANAFLTARLEWNENADTSALMQDLSLRYFGDPGVAAYYQRREAALGPLLARCYDGATTPKEVAARNTALLEGTMVKEFPSALAILAQARLKATDPVFRRRLKEEQAGLLAVMERAQAMAEARMQQLRPK